MQNLQNSAFNKHQSSQCMRYKSGKNTFPKLFTHFQNILNEQMDSQCFGINTHFVQYASTCLRLFSIPTRLCLRAAVTFE